MTKKHMKIASFSLKVNKKDTSEQGWLIATGTINGKRVSGYGTTAYNAITDAIRDYKLISNL